MNDRFAGRGKQDTHNSKLGRWWRLRRLGAHQASVHLRRQARFAVHIRTKHVGQRVFEIETFDSLLVSAAIDELHDVTHGASVFAFSGQTSRVLVTLRHLPFTRDHCTRSFRELKSTACVLCVLRFRYGNLKATFELTFLRDKTSTVPPQADLRTQSQPSSDTGCPRQIYCISARQIYCISALAWPYRRIVCAYKLVFIVRCKSLFPLSWTE